MAQIEYIENKLVTPWQMTEDTVEKPISDDFYESLMDKIDEASKNLEKEEIKPLSKDSDVNKLLQETVASMFENPGVDFSDSYAVLEPEDKIAFKELLAEFLNAIETEKEGAENNGLTQALLNRLFPDQNTTTTDPYQSVRNELERLRKKGVNPDTLMSIIVPMMLEASLTSATTELPSYYGYVSYGTKDITLDSIQKAMQELAAMTATVDAAAEVPPIEIPPEIIPEVPDATETPVIPDTPSGEITDETEPAGETVPVTEPTEPEVTDGTEPTEPVVETPVEEQPAAETQEPTVTEEAAEQAQEADEATEAAAEAAEAVKEAQEAATEPVEEVQEEAAAEAINLESVSFGSNAGELSSQVNLSRASVRIRQGAVELDEIAVASAMTNAQVEQSVSQIPFSEEAAQSVQTQITQFIGGQMASVADNSTREMTMVLNPENLGQVTVQITSRDGEITVRIAAASEETQNILRERLPSLMQNLSNINNGVREIQIVHPNQTAANMDFNLSNGGNHTAYQNQYSSSGESAAAAEEEDNADTIMRGANRLWQMA